MYLGAMFFMIMGWYIMLVIAFSGMLVLGMTLLTAGFVLKYINKKKGNDKKYPKVFVIIGGILTIISLIILFIICRIIAIIGIFVMGTALLIVGLVSRYTNKKKGIDKKYPKVCIITGGVFMSISLLMFVIGAISYFNGSKYNPAIYDPHTSSYIEDKKYNETVILEVVRCLDENDVDGMKSLFCEEMQLYDDLQNQIEYAMDIYAGQSISYKNMASETISYTRMDGFYNIKIDSIEIRSLTTDEGEEYFIDVTNVLVNDDNPMREGIIKIQIRNPNDLNEIIVEIGK